MPASTTSAHGLTREQVQAILVEPLMAASVFLAAGPRILDVTAAGPVRIPTLVGMIAPSWVGENVLIPEVAADFGEVRLLDGILSLKSLTRFSKPRRGRTEPRREARTACLACPVRAACLGMALAFLAMHLWRFWGGTSHQERVRLRQAAARDTAMTQKRAEPRGVRKQVRPLLPAVSAGQQGSAAVSGAGQRPC